MTPRRTTAIVFGDLAGSTRLYEQLGDERAVQVVATSVQVMCDAVGQNGGVVVRTMGDGIMAAFPDPNAALASAVQMQRTAEALPRERHGSEEIRICLRIGMNFGPAVTTDDDFFGEVVNIAARMLAVAKARQIIMTGDMSRALGNAGAGEMRTLYCVGVKGRAEPVEIVQVLWDRGEGTLFDGLTDQTGSLTAPALVVLANGIERVFPSTDTAISFGRDASNHVLTGFERASRWHATAERRGRNWILSDHSTNGTFVRMGGAEDIELRREEMILRGRCEISLGRLVEQTPPAQVIWLDPLGPALKDGTPIGANSTRGHP
jgi:adenylate cyclase